VSRTESLYGRLPVFAQNLALSAYGVRYRRQRLGGDFAAQVERFREREEWSADRLRDYTTTRLRELLILGWDEIPYYSRRWKFAGIGRHDLAELELESLAGLPLTPKDDVRRFAEDLRVIRRTRRERVQKEHTSGSTGTPTTIYTAARVVQGAMAAREARSFGWAGVSISLPRATIGARLVVPRPDSPPPYYRYNRAEHQVYLSAFHLSAGNIPSYVEALRRYHPQVFTGMAHSWYLFADMAGRAGLEFGPGAKVAILGSEKTWPHMRERIESVFGLRVYEEYGSVENCVLATECELGGLHVHPDFGLVEILDEHDHPVPPGTVGRLVCTGLLNDIQPLIRYEIGDLAAWSPRVCPCGRSTLPLLERIAGRQNDVIYRGDGVAIIGGDEIFSGVEHVIEGQVVQESIGRFRIRVVPATGFGPAEEARLAERLSDRVGPAAVIVESVEMIERTKQGKFKPVVNEMTPGEIEMATGGRDNER